MEEYLDIVDEKDHVIGRDTREAVHEAHAIHRGVHVLVVNSRGELLLQKRALTKADRPGFYDASVGAQVRSGEAYEAAAVRETQEELGFTPAKLIKICDYKSYSDRQRENRRLFYCVSDGPFTLQKDEVDSVQFLSPAQIQEMINEGEPFTDGFVLSFNHYLEYKNI